MLGNNMFAYCLNNPVNHLDSHGYYTDGQIHDFVIEEIVKREARKDRALKHNRADTLIIYDHAWRNKWFGFCDLYDPNTGEVWEVKKQSNSYTCSTKYALDQLNNYINNGYLVSDSDLKRRLPTSSLGSGLFSKTDAWGNMYSIHYWEEGNGIIRYEYVVKPSQTLVLFAGAMTAYTAYSIACQPGRKDIQFHC